MNRETVNMVRSPISVEGNIRLVPYYPAYDTALAWYQDAQLCKQVDNRDFVYDLPLLKRMYHYLDTHGELFYIEYRGVLCGDVSLRTTGELAIVICKEYQNKHIGRKVIEKMLELARERGLAECFAHIYSFNTQSQKMFESIGFVLQDEERYIYKLQKGEPTMTKLTLEEKQELSSPDPAQKIRGRRKSRKRIEKLEEPLRQVYKLLDCVPKSTEIILQEAWKKGEYIDIVTLHRRLMELELMGYVKQNTPGYFGTSAN